MIQIDYQNKPSITTINAALKKAIKNGETWIQFIWGENQITIEKTAYGWSGHGWIGKNSGYDIAFKLK